MVVSNEQYFQSVQMLRRYPEKDQYVEECSKMQLWDEEGENTKDERENYCSIIYDAAHRNVADLAKAMGYSVRQLAMRFGFQYNTLSSWAKNPSKVSYPEYLMMQEIMGQLKIPRE